MESHSVASWLARHPHGRVALVDEERALSFGELDHRAARLAAVLAAAGVARGERVALLLANRSAYLEAVFACARLRAIAVPLNNRLAPPEIARQLADCAPRALLAEPDLVDRVATRPPFVLLAGRDYEAALAGAGREAPALAADPEDPLLLMYTSGTTGAPKGALLPQRKTLFNALNAEIFFGLTPEDRVLVALPLFHSFGLNILSLPVLYAGGAVFLHARFEPRRVWRAVEEQRISFFGAVPSMFRELLDALPGHDTASLRFLFTAGAAIPVDLIRAYQRHGLVLKQGFGQTETSVLCCLEAKDALRKAGSVGRPVFHAEVRIVSNPDDPPASWREAAPGDTGEICVRGPIAMLGYWRQPEETAATLRDGWLRTGDLGTWDEEGFVTLVGRARDMYISGGENVYPAEVEAAYAEHPEIVEIAVVGIPDERWGESGRAYVVLRPGATLDTDSLRAFGRERLAAFKIPTFFEAIATLPKTVTGKVQRHLLARDRA